jgi:hypothetical protein
VLSRARFWWQVFKRGAGGLNTAAGWVGFVVLMLGVAAGITVPLVFRVSNWLTAVILMGVIVVVVLEGSYHVWAATEANRKAAEADANKIANDVLGLQADELKDEAAKRRRVQADKVYVVLDETWLGLNMIKKYRTFEVTNKSTGPVYDLRLTWQKGTELLDNPDKVTLLDADGSKRFIRDFGEVVSPKILRAAVDFRDAAGVIWRKHSDGKLDEISSAQ